MLWVAIKDMQAPYSQWEGTFIMLHDDGHVERVTVNPDGSEDIVQVK